MLKVFGENSNEYFKARYWLIQVVVWRTGLSSSVE